jgi:hypothetical protein
MEGCKLLEPRESVTRGRLSGVVAWALACALALAPLPVIAEGLGLRVHDAVGPPGGRIGVVLRTYASKPIEQGEICFQARAMVPSQPAGLATYESATVFSVAGDVVLLATPRLFDDPQVLVMQFESVSATINSIDGPLAVMYFQLDESVQPGQVYELTVDLQNTFLVDENGIPIAISPRPGALEVRAPDGPIRFAAHAENVGVGGLARTSVTTFEPIRLSAGQAGFRYDPTIVDGPPTVIMDPRHGQAAFVADVSTPGLVLVSFTSPDGSLNEVPGDVIEIRLPISPSAPPGTTYPVTLDPALTFMTDAQGQPVSLELIPGLLEIDALAPGMVVGLTVAHLAGNQLQLDWNADCGDGSVYAIYRGDLVFGYDSLAPEPGFCSVPGTSATIPAGPGAADFFLVVPHLDGFEGEYGIDSSGEGRSAAEFPCFPQDAIHDCVP